MEPEHLIWVQVKLLSVSSARFGQLQTIQSSEVCPQAPSLTKCVLNILGLTEHRVTRPNFAGSASQISTKGCQQPQTKNPINLSQANVGWRYEIRCGNLIILTVVMHLWHQKPHMAQRLKDLSQCFMLNKKKKKKHASKMPFSWMN